MQAFLNFWRPITLRHTLVLAGAVILALASKDVLSSVWMSIIEELLFGVGFIAEMYYYSKTKRLMLGGPPIVYVPSLGWIAAETCWPPNIFRELLPPSAAIDAVFLVVTGFLLVLALVALGRDDAQHPKL